MVGKEGWDVGTSLVSGGLVPCLLETRQGDCLQTNVGPNPCYLSVWAARIRIQDLG